MHKPFIYHNSPHSSHLSSSRTDSMEQKPSEIINAWFLSRVEMKSYFDIKWHAKTYYNIISSEATGLIDTEINTQIKPLHSSSTFLQFTICLDAWACIIKTIIRKSFCYTFDHTEKIPHRQFQNVIEKS